MRQHLCRSLFALAAVVLSAGMAMAQEHPGEHPGTPAEHPGKSHPRDIKAEIQMAIKSYAQQKSGKSKVYTITDPKTKKTWRLTLKKFHPVTKISNSSYFDCTDFAASNKKDILDLDFFLKPKGKGWQVTRVLIHKVNGAPRYTYEQKGSKWFRVEGKMREPLS